MHSKHCSSNLGLQKHNAAKETLSWSHANESIPCSTFCVNVFIWISICLCVYCIAWNYNHKVSQSSVLWIGYLHRMVPSGTIFYFCEETEREPNRETGPRMQEKEREWFENEEEEESRGGDADWAKERADWQEAAHTGLKTSSVFCLCVPLLPAVLQGWTH